MDFSSYYLNRKDSYLRKLGRFANMVSKELAIKFGSEGAELFLEDVQKEYKRIIPEFPYVGRDSNPLTRNLVEAGYGLALFRAISEHGGTLEEAGELSHLAMKYSLESIPFFVRRLIVKQKYSRRGIRRLKERARISQERQYPGNWVFEIVDGDDFFDIGTNYFECGIEKFMRSQGAADFTPYLCNTDYSLFNAMGMGLTRTKTLAWGCDRCDFRIHLKGDPQQAWPPLFIERSCGNP